MLKKRNLIALAFLSFGFITSQSNFIYAAKPSDASEISQSGKKKSSEPSDEAKKLYTEKYEEMVTLKSRINALQKNNSSGDYIIAPENKDSFYATTSKEFIKNIAELSKEIYAAGETKKEDILSKSIEKRNMLELDIGNLNIKRDDYIKLKERIKNENMPAADFMLILRQRFGSYLLEGADFSDLESPAKKIALLEKIQQRIDQQIDAANQSFDSLDMYYLYTQRLTVINNHFSDYLVTKILYRHNGEQFSGALLYSKPKNHLILAFTGTVTGSDWGRNLQFTKHPDEFIPGQTLSLHKGFVNSYNEIRDQINGSLSHWVEMYKSDPANKGRTLEITTTGHSKGAAMSTLAALDIAANLLPTHLGPKNSEFPWKVNNPNFASPRFAGTHSAKIIEDFLGKYNILRFVNYWDIVPSVVAEFTGSVHVGLGFVFNAGVFTDITVNGPIVNWHSMSKYAELAPEEFQKSRQEGIELVEINNKMNALKKEIDELEKKHNFKKNKSWLSAF
jgi:hypothetical protein